MAAESPIRVEFDLSGFSPAMEAAARDEIPFAFAMALTRIGAVTRKAVQTDLPQHFTIRNPFVSQNIRIDPPKVPKGTMSIDVGSRQNKGNTLMELEAIGGIGRAKSGGELAIPTSVTRPEKTMKIPRSQRPKTLIKRGQAFVFTGKDGKPGVFTRDGKTIHKAYALASSVKIPAIWPFWSVVQTAVADQWPAIAAAALSRALKSRRA